MIRAYLGTLNRFNGFSVIRSRQNRSNGSSSSGVLYHRAKATVLMRSLRVKTGFDLRYRPGYSKFVKLDRVATEDSVSVFLR